MENLTRGGVAFVIAEPQKDLIRYELYKVNGVVDTLARNWPEGQAFTPILGKPAWLRLLFARKYYLRHGKDIGDILGIADIGGFSLNELIDHDPDHRFIPAAPANGVLVLISKRINNMAGFSRIQGLTNLQWLDLSGNQLTTLPVDLFAGLINLRTLYLSNNRLTTLLVGLFTELTNLQTLWLSVNRLTTLPAGLFAGLTNLLRLDLSANPLQGQGIEATTYRGDELRDLLEKLAPRAEAAWLPAGHQPARPEPARQAQGWREWLSERIQRWFGH